MSAIVPKLVTITAARESARLEHLVFSGAINSVLREGRTARVAGSVAAGFAGVLAFNALADERTEATVASRLMPVVRETAAVVPVPLEEPFYGEWHFTSRASPTSITLTVLSRLTPRRGGASSPSARHQRISRTFAGLRYMTCTSSGFDSLSTDPGPGIVGCAPQAS